MRSWGIKDSLHGSSVMNRDPPMQCPPQSAARLETFLSQFDLTDLGDGNRVAGVNVLAACLYSVANLSPPGSGILSKNERAFEFGTNLVVSGGLSSSLYQDLVGAQLARQQDNYNAHIKNYLMAADQDRKSPHPRPWSSHPEPEMAPSQDTFFGLQQKGHLPASTYEKKWEEILNHHPQPTREERYRNTQVYLRTADQSEIRQGLAYAHRGKPFLHFGMQSPEQFRRAQPVLSKVMNGSNLGGPLSSLQQGFVLIDDPFNSFYQVIKDNPQSFPRFV